MEIQRPKQLITDSGQVILGKELSYVNHGYNADVWCWFDDSGQKFAVKTYKKGCHKLGLQNEVADIFQELEFYNFPNLYTSVRTDISHKNIDGYIMEYTEEDSERSVLDIPSVNLFSSIQALEEDLLSISSYGIFTSDVKGENTMVTKDGVLRLFDYDLFFVDRGNRRNMIEVDNLHTELRLLRDVLTHAVIFDSSFTNEERRAAKDYINSNLSLRLCRDRMPSELLDSSFCQEETPKQLLKSLSHTQ